MKDNDAASGDKTEFKSLREHAFEMFGEMRHSTPDEEAAYSDMLRTLSKPTDEKVVL